MAKIVVTPTIVVAEFMLFQKKSFLSKGRLAATKSYSTMFYSFQATLLEISTSMTKILMTDPKPS